MKTISLLAATLALAVTGLAQTPDAKPSEPKFYKLEIVLKELEAGKVVASRNYVMATAFPANSNASVRTGDKVAVPTATGAANSQFTYMDIGVNIDCRITSASAAEIGLHVAADISSVADNKGSSLPPTIVQTRLNGDAIVPFRKPITVFSVDGASSKRQTQLEITATPVQ